jgi:putative multiple sugar transport system permease protein
MNAIKKIFGGDTRQLGMIFALIASSCSSSGAPVSPWTPDNVNNIIQGNAYILVLAIGMVLVIIAGHIDLSVGSIAAFVGIVVALAIRDWGMPWWLAILLGLASVPSSAPGRALGRLRRHPGLHRHPGRHAHLPRPQPVGRQVQHRPRAPRPSRSSAPARCPSGAPTPATTTSPCCSASWVCRDHRRRDAQPRQLVKIGAEVEEAWVMWTRLALICLVIMGVMLLIASGSQGLPRLRADPRRARHRLRLPLKQDRSSAGTSTPSVATATPPSSPV